MSCFSHILQVEYSTCAGHTDTIFDCRLSPVSPDVLATCSYDSTVKVGVMIVEYSRRTYSQWILAVACGTDMEHGRSHIEVHSPRAGLYHIQVRVGLIDVDS